MAVHLFCQVLPLRQILRVNPWNNEFMFYYGQCVAQCGKRSRARKAEAIRKNVPCSSAARVQRLKIFWINPRRSTAELLLLRDDVLQSTQQSCRDHQLVPVMRFVWQGFSSPLFKMEENISSGWFQGSFCC